MGQDSLSIEAPPPKPKAGFVSNVMFQFDNRNERYYEVRGRMNGIKLGLEFYKRFRTGFAFYANNDFYRIEPPEGTDSIARSARFDYATYFGELVIFRNFNWEVSTIAAVGSGDIRVNTFDVRRSVPEFRSLDTLHDVRVFDIGLNAHYKVFPWLGVGGGVGLRNVNNLSDANIRNAFHDPYFDFKIKLFLGYVYKGVFKPEAIQAEREYYNHRKQKRKAYIKSKFNS